MSKRSERQAHEEERRKQREQEALDWCLNRVGMTRDELITAIGVSLANSDNPAKGMGADPEILGLIMDHPQCKGTNGVMLACRAIQTLTIRLAPR
jgi:hypothetical protein